MSFTTAVLPTTENLVVAAFIIVMSIRAKILDIAEAITPFVSDWSNKYCGTEQKRGAREYKQLLKNKFVHLTQFCPNPHERKRRWRHDLETAAEETANELCPNRGSNAEHLAIYRSIQTSLDKAMKTNPRQKWLYEKACAWLQLLAPEDQNSQIKVEGEVFYPRHAIKIAHHIFLRCAGKFESFMKYLDKRRKHNKTIDQLIEAHGSY